VAASVVVVDLERLVVQAGDVVVLGPAEVAVEVGDAGDADEDRVVAVRLDTDTVLR
jgi:hypothetical protein